MFGTQVLVTADVALLRMYGSVKSCRLPMTVKSATIESAGRIIGSLIDSAVRTSDAPSTRAASRISLGTAWSAVKMMMTLYPVHSQMPILITDGNAIVTDRKLTAMPPSSRTETIGLMPGV